MSQTLDYSPQGLPRKLGDGLVMRWATRADAEELALFVATVAGGEAGPEEPLRRVVYSYLATDEHPTTGAADYLVVVDEDAGGKIVSSTSLISQSWTYAGIGFGVGQPEAVMTDPAYRRRGLIRKQFEVLHERSKARGELVQVISGIPWYYRQFGYTTAIDYGGARQLYWPKLPQLLERVTETYRSRKAGPEDIAILARLYPYHSQKSLLVRQRDEATWQYELSRNDRGSLAYQEFWLVEDGQDSPAAYYRITFRPDLNAIFVNEMGVAPGHSWRMVAQFICQVLKKRADEFSQENGEQLAGISFSLGTAHRLYDALEGELEQQTAPGAWQVRVADLPVFLWKISPALEKRLAQSPFTNYTGELRLNFFQSGLVMSFEAGRLSNIQEYWPSEAGDGDASFLDLTFLDVLFGRRSLAEISYILPDCQAASPAASALLASLFPKEPSCVLQLV